MANNFADDARIIEFWRFENNLTAGKAGNDLTASAGGVAYKSGSPLEGSYSLDLESESNQWASRADANLSAGFPLKSGDTTKKISIAFWFKPESAIAGDRYLVSKSGLSAGLGSLSVRINAGSLEIHWGYGGATSFEIYDTDVVLGTGIYHVGVAVDGVAKTVLVRLYNSGADEATTFNHTFDNELYVGGSSFIVGNEGAFATGNDYDGLIDEVVVANDVLTADEFDQIRQGTFVGGGSEPLLLYGNGIARPAADTPASAILSLKGRSAARVATDARIIGIFGIQGAGMAEAEAIAVTGKILNLYGLSESQAVSDALAGMIARIYGESCVRVQVDAYGRKTIDLELLADPNLLVRFRPHIGGGGVLTYRAGAPDAATYWDIIGVAVDGFDEPPHGFLRWHYVKADKAGLAVNIYVAPTDPALAGRRDRIVVRRADA